MEKQYVFCDIGTEYLYIIYMNLKVKGLIQHSCLKSKNERHSAGRIYEEISLETLWDMEK